jgi:hypothetical protein
MRFGRNIEIYLPNVCSELDVVIMGHFGDIEIRPIGYTLRAKVCVGDRIKIKIINKTN